MKVWIVNSFVWKITNGTVERQTRTIGVFQTRTKLNQLMEEAFSAMFPEAIGYYNNGLTQDKCQIERFDGSILKYVKLYGANEGLCIQAFRHDVTESKDL